MPKAVLRIFWHTRYTTLEQQYQRAMTGKSPALGAKGRPADSSKFFNNTDMKTAMEEAERKYAKNPSEYTDKDTGKISIVIKFDRPIGEGYKSNSKTNQSNGTAGEYRWTNEVIVNLDTKTKKPYTAFPNLSNGVKKDDPLNKR